MLNNEINQGRMHGKHLKGAVESSCHGKGAFLQNL